MGIKIYLDDIREAPDGWVKTRWPQDLIDLFEDNKVDAISLDHDLGSDNRTGKDVLYWIQDQVINDSNFIPPEIFIHSQNPVERKAMMLTAKRIWQIYSARTDRTDDSLDED